MEHSKKRVAKIHTRKTKTVPALIRKLDDIFSQYIRLRDSDSNGYCRCISCGAVLFWKKIHNGHFVNRGHMSTRYHEKNCNAQCPKCNLFDEGNNIGYTRGLLRKYGSGVIEELDIAKHSICKRSPTDYELLIDHYTKEVEKLKAEKGLK